jgi:hypothetical protein
MLQQSYHAGSKKRVAQYPRMRRDAIAWQAHVMVLNAGGRQVR